MSTFAEALMFAALKHKGQTRNNGDNYIIHPVRVSQEVKTDQQRIIALLHDTIEDTNTTLEEIALHFGKEVAIAVDCLTHRKGESYKDYIERVKQNPDAVKVKMADICDNLTSAPSENAIKKGTYGLTELLSLT